MTTARPARDVGVADDPARELGADDGEVAELGSARQVALRVEQRESGGRPRAARRAVDLAVGEHRHVPLRERPVSLVLPEDHAVHVPELGLERVDDVVRGLDRGLELAPECDQARQLAGRDPFLEARVERPAEGDVDDAARRLDPLPPDEGGDVPEPHRAHPAVLDPRPRLEAPRRDVDDDAVLALAALHDALVERPRDERDRPVPARGRVPLVVEEHDAEIGAVVVRRHDVAAVHVGVAARLEDQEAPEPIEPVAREAAPLEDRPALEGRHAARDDAKRLAARVVVDGRDAERAHSSEKLGYRCVSSSR